MPDIFFERYTNIYHFMDTIGGRKNNAMFGKSSEKRSDNGWSGTDTYQTAVDQFSHGLPEKAEKLKKSLEAFKAKSNISTTKTRPIDYYYGYSPNIPAAIIGLPKSMKKVERTPQKVKAISICFNMVQSYSVKAETLEKAGETVLQLVYALECRGYRVALDILPFACTESRRYFINAITVKDWKSSLDMLKLSFPITSPAMFRRFGFKWAETLPGVTKYVPCYGAPIDKADLVKQLNSCGYDTSKTYVIDVNDCKSVEFDPLKVAKTLGLID